MRLTSPRGARQANDGFALSALHGAVPEQVSIVG